MQTISKIIDSLNMHIAGYTVAYYTVYVGLWMVFKSVLHLPYTYSIAIPALNRPNTP